MRSLIGRSRRSTTRSLVDQLSTLTSVGAGVPTVNLYSPGTAAGSNVEPCAALIDTVGMQFVQLQFKATATVSTPTMGAFYSFI